MVDCIDGPGPQLKSITHLCNNCILLELNSQESAMWIRDAPNRNVFLEKLGGMAMIKDRQYSIVIPFLPITTELDSPDMLIQLPTMLHRMENENNIQTGSISCIRWIKDPAKCSPTQKVAHALTFITLPDTANCLLRDSFYWGLDRLCPYKDKREPVWCLKCQQTGHLAKDCKQMEDMCSLCALPHHTQGCTSLMVFCVNCQNDTHPSNNRQCPDFIRCCNMLHDCTPENRMPYFPTLEEWTQVELPPHPLDPIKWTRPPPNPFAAQGQLRQMTLGEAMNVCTHVPK
ncbi:hypothetical protein BKA82DRAFT_161214 [Pisolithus tinctorius]|uniref:CCHC-type domain-containing protein n=1 Tax=Pisolithus tinctorius Marx 270 TaxID=870435 RepID=A0A0C3NPE6_PISTI|nr:hypothetical protein BKA82DRAFT_161214 [Pisolithus tinctorius]KIN97173.1 hypothetical protein M404DRAFT_161214 [Pisolithus tinctorius Marx 270]